MKLKEVIRIDEKFSAFDQSETGSDAERAN